jgi:hypothetical protein
MPFVMTSGVATRMREDISFSKAVIRALKRFTKKDWGTVDAEDQATNDQMTRSLDLGGGGMVLGAYGSNKKNKIWVIRDTERTTVLFPDEY